MFDSLTWNFLFSCLLNAIF
jgi:hypothetical protein